MAPRKRRRHAPAALEIATLPADILLEIVARTDFFTLVRCAAVCKHLRCDILSPPFIRRISQQVAPCILAHLTTCIKKRLTLVHPPTPTAASFCDHLSPLLSRRAANLLLKYRPVTSRRGIIILDHRPLLVWDQFSRQYVFMQPESSEHNFNLCVYNPMTDHHTFLSRPPGFQSRRHTSQKYVLLTTVDGIDDTFMLLFVNSYGDNIKVHATTSSSSTWELVTTQARHHDIPWWSAKLYSDPAVLHGGVLHWLTYLGDQIVIYDVRTGMSAQMKLPPTNHKASQVHLATTLDGNLLKLLTIEGFKLSTWLQLPKVQPDTDGSGWSLENVIDIEDEICSVCPNILLGVGTDVVVAFDGSGKRSGNVMPLRIQKKNHCDVLVVIDLETEEMHMDTESSMLIEIDLSYHLETMKVFF